jgi:hypothetical protein
MRTLGRLFPPQHLNEVERLAPALQVASFEACRFAPGLFAALTARAVALFGAPNAIIARTKRRSASPKFEAPYGE